MVTTLPDGTFSCSTNSSYKGCHQVAQNFSIMGDQKVIMKVYKLVSVIKTEDASRIRVNYDNSCKYYDNFVHGPQT